MKTCKFCLEEGDNLFELEDSAGNIDNLCENCVIDMVEWAKKPKGVNFEEIIKKMKLTDVDKLFNKTIIGSFYYPNTLYGKTFTY